MAEHLSKEQEKELMRLKEYFPFRIVFGVLYKNGKFETYAENTRRRLNSFARISDLKVFEIQ
jgi:hypothetical protein